MSIEIETDVQWVAVDHSPIPAEAFASWVNAAVAAGASSSSRAGMLGLHKNIVTVRVVDEAESADLNQNYRGKSGCLLYTSDAADE